MSLNRKIIRFHMLLKELKLEHAKADMLSGYGVDSSKVLSDAELDELITALERQKEASKKLSDTTTRTLRSKVLNSLANIGIVNEGNTQNYWERVNKYLSNPRIAGKLLYQMSDAELEACRRKLYLVKKEMDKRAQEEKYWAAHN